jgi:hypothetical protein
LAFLESSFYERSAVRYESDCLDAAVRALEFDRIPKQSETTVSIYQARSWQTPEISLESVMKSAGLIEQMGRERLKPRKETV